MTDKCGAYSHKGKCRRNAKRTTPWGELCEKCATRRVEELFTVHFGYFDGPKMVWAVKYLSGELGKDL